MNVRPAAVAGYFYPADPSGLQQQLASLMPAPETASRKPRALIVPHAGYRYSGAIAGAAYAAMQPGDYRRVLLLGPAHRVLLRGIAVPTVSAFSTPLGTVPLATQRLQKLSSLTFVQQRDDAHAEEHALEVQLPFLQRQLGAFDLLPLVVGDCDPEQVADVIERLVDDDTLVVISTDLSHFHPQAQARGLDAETIAEIEAAVPDLQPEQACGAMPLNGYLHYLNRQSRPVLLRAGNSGDVGGPRDRVVGYASFRVD